MMPRDDRQSTPGPGRPSDRDGRGIARASTALLRAGGALAVVFVLLPGVGFAAVMAVLASLDTWHGGEGPVTAESRVGFLAVAVAALVFVVACAVALWRSLRRGWIALTVVGLGGLVCISIGARGIVEATGVDTLITVLSWGVGATGVMLSLGAALGLLVRLRAIGHRGPGLRPG